MNQEKEDQVEVASEDLLSADLDDFLDNPDTTTVFKKETPPEFERNVCVTFNMAASDGKLVQQLLQNLSNLCTINQAITETHKVAVLTYFTDNKRVIRYGYCDELSARNVVYRLSEISGIEAEVIQDFNTELEKVITEEDLGKRPFRF